MKFLISKDAAGGEAWLTNENAASRYGIPNLEITAEDVNGIFGPADLIGDSAHPVTAAEIVAGWASSPDRTVEECAAAHAFCGQWPQGPR